MSNVRVIVYATTDEHCPPTQRFTARTLVDGKPMPVTHYAATEPAVRSAAVQWWDEQMEAERKRAEVGQRLRDARANKGAVP
jgi:hypothetical protein